MRKVDGIRLVYQFRYLPKELIVIPENAMDKPEPIELSSKTLVSDFTVNQQGLENLV